MALDTSAPFFVGFSGGMDSTVLLHALSQLPLQITALHVDHGLQTDSMKWYQHCEQQCKVWNIPFQGAHLNVQRDKKIGLEASARNARYAWFEEKVPETGYLLTAHHQRDQVETLLFNMLRGSGVNGLSGMPNLRVINQLKLARPLLNIPYRALQNYAKQHQLNWVEDPSNQQMEFSRNKIRHTVLPALEEFRADAIAMLSRTASNIADSKSLLNEILADDLSKLPQLALNPLDHSIGLVVSELSGYSQVRVQHILRFWLETKCGVSVSRQLIKQLYDWVNKAPGSTAILQESGRQYRFCDEALYVMPELNERLSLKEYVWKDVDKPLVIPDLGIQLRSKTQLKKLSNVKIVFRDTALSLQHSGKKISLKDFMMQRKIPAWLRYRAPLIVTPAANGKQLILHDVITDNNNAFCDVEISS